MAMVPCPLVTFGAGVCISFKRINPCKAPGPDGIFGQALKVCEDQLPSVFKDIFNMSLLQCVLPHMLQGGHHCTSSQKDQNPLSKRAAVDKHGIQDTLELLQVHQREYPDWLHYCLVWVAAKPSTVRLYRGWGRLFGTSSGRNCHSWRTSTPSTVGRRQARSLKKTTPVTHYSACCCLTDNTAASRTASSLRS
ncbi:hypothetical protein L3Q82_025184 [Scortum barcoo]|uniref:Uncharacterized protein n=1 Tax=Scortum barcoo TaxID=214431 RepID=A0ACB8WRN2_9TELE|nr:hypothetical protein L3Q82_025184 [Scortum barcoo]